MRLAVLTGGDYVENAPGSRRRAGLGTSQSWTGLGNPHMASDDIADLLLGMVDTLRESSSEDPIDVLMLGCLTMPTVARVGVALLAADGASVTARGSDEAAHHQAERLDGSTRTCLRTGEVLISERSCTVPMRCEGRTLGALTIFADAASAGDELVRIGKSLADAAATVMVIQWEAGRNRTTVQQLQTALTSRVGIEQAKGMVAGRLGVGMDEAFRILRDYARAHNRRLAELATQVVNGEADPVAIRDRVPARDRGLTGSQGRSQIDGTAQLSDGSDG
jgi:hypothetical protein